MCLLVFSHVLHVVVVPSATEDKFIWSVLSPLVTFGSFLSVQKSPPTIVPLAIRINNPFVPKDYIKYDKEICHNICSH